MILYIPSSFTVLKTRNYSAMDTAYTATRAYTFSLTHTAFHSECKRNTLIFYRTRSYVDRLRDGSKNFVLNVSHITVSVYRDLSLPGAMMYRHYLHRFIYVIYEAMLFYCAIKSLNVLIAITYASIEQLILQIDT